MKSHLVIVSTLTGLALACVGTAAFAQEELKDGAESCKVLQENEQVRVTDVRLKPGQKLPMHSHPNYVVYSISPGKVRFTYADGKTSERELKAEETLFRPAESHAVENIGTTECRALTVDLKSYQSMAHEHVTHRPGDIQTGTPVVASGGANGGHERGSSQARALYHPLQSPRRLQHSRALASCG